MKDKNWIVCQIGAREHYAIPRALQSRGRLNCLFTDYWHSNSSFTAKLPGLQKLKDRNHPDLSTSLVRSFNCKILGRSLFDKLAGREPWQAIIERNLFFQKRTIAQLEKLNLQDGEITLFSYSYAALELFRYAKSRGWTTVLGQIDPGPEEERIVAAEQEQSPASSSLWKPAPSSYWTDWQEEVTLADRVVVNSSWSAECLTKEGVSGAKVEIIPLVYTPDHRDQTRPPRDPSEPFHLLFLGQFNLRKGAARLLEAMRMLRGENIKLTIAGPSDLPATEWEDLKSVTWVGPVPRSTVMSYYSNADAFVLPTLSDGFALTQLEASAAGLPLLVSSSCGEVVQEGINGMIFPDLRPSSIAETIRCAAAKADWAPPTTKPFDLTDLGKRLTKS